MIRVFPFNDIEKVSILSEQILNESKVIIGNNTGWHQHLKKNHIGATATAQALIILKILDKHIDDDSIQTIQRNYITENSESGGWSFLTNGGVITIPATSTVLKSFIINEIDDEKIRCGIKWIIDAQNEDGGWGLQSNSESSYYTTYTALDVLKDYNKNLSNEIKSKTKSWLVDTQNEDGGWGKNNSSTPIDTAFALLSLYLLELNNRQVLKNGVEYLHKNWDKNVMWENSNCIYDFEVFDKENNLRRIKVNFYVTAWVLKALLLNGETIENSKIEKSLKWVLKKTLSKDFKCDSTAEDGYFWAFYDSVTLLYLFKNLFKEQKFDKIISFHKIQITLNKNDYLSAVFAVMLICIPSILIGSVISEHIISIPRLVTNYIDVKFVYIFSFLYLLLGSILLKLERLKKETFISLIVVPVILGLVGL